ncbi:MAG TPA: hypothetical protein HA359_06960 [Candidatus Poseidoniaceae archaeon]|nr:MAG TPA: hypothetical protein D7H84_06935 [Candidatus Poseidoniales archaeon]DAC57895.1 MAG TPA: hypothetical protein D7I03_06630 [Candidatus Poseidoniales archaeon]HII23980.1 hypothetical protein [Candidatus Poseidoniaceae archaeon]HII51001.1 hypothetical protein [Candidatus Poseidoniaceae archaeon]|tara:strand:+ start:694 stop:1350 length:657 start_codon:yes stop_codon:yes gene_type:complete
MDYSLEISKLESHAKIVKILAKIAILSISSTIIVLLFGFIIPDPAIFLSIVIIPIAMVVSNNLIEKYYDTKIEYTLNELLSHDNYQEIEQTNRDKEKKSNYSNSEHLRIRGSDEKGPAFGKNSKDFSTHGKRIDAMENRDYDEIENVNTKGERMLRDADKLQSEAAAKQWEKSQLKDQDLIEAGVDNLGDLIKTGWFEKNQQDGAVKQLYDNNEGNQI